MVGFTESDVIGCVNGKVSGINIVAFQGGFQQFWMVDCSVLLEIDLLILA